MLERARPVKAASTRRLEAARTLRVLRNESALVANYIHELSGHGANRYRLARPGRAVARRDEYMPP